MQGTRSGKFRILPVILFVAFAAWYWISNKETVPLTGRTQVVDISMEEEVALGVASYREVLSEEKVLSLDAPETRKVREIGGRIARAAADIDPGFQWEFNTIQSNQANAFALPGGKVAVYTGILPISENDDGLAVIMGHEIAHALARHGAERMAMQKLTQVGIMAAGASVSDMERTQQYAILGALGLGAQYGINLPFSRDHESEADRMGLILLARACFDPREAPELWKRMGRNAGASPAEWQSTHPSSETRIRQFQEWMPEALAIRKEYCG